MKKKRVYFKECKDSGIEKYIYLVSYGFWSALRCWKNEQWIYKVEDENGTLLWDLAKEGKDIQYKADDFTIDCIFNSHVRIESEFEASAKDGVYCGTVDELKSDVVFKSETKENSSIYVYCKGVQIGFLDLSIDGDADTFLKELADEGGVHVSTLSVTKTANDVEKEVYH